MMTRLTLALLLVLSAAPVAAGPGEGGPSEQAKPTIESVRQEFQARFPRGTPRAAVEKWLEASECYYFVFERTGTTIVGIDIPFRPSPPLRPNQRLSIEILLDEKEEVDRVKACVYTVPEILIAK